MLLIHRKSRREEMLRDESETIRKQYEEEKENWGPQVTDKRSWWS